MTGPGSSGLRGCCSLCGGGTGASGHTLWGSGCTGCGVGASSSEG